MAAACKRLFLVFLLLQSVLLVFSLSDVLEDLDDLNAEALHSASHIVEDEIDEGPWEEDQHSIPVDDKDVIVLSKSNYTEFLKNNRFVMVEFYAPWCGHCQNLAPEYAAAATKLKGEVALAKVDATVEHELAQENEVEGYPTIYFYVDGSKKAYSGQRTGDDIVKWINKRTGPPVINVDSVTAAEEILSKESPIAVAFLDNLKGAEAEVFESTARQEDGVLFYQTSKPEVAAVFKLKDKKSPAVILLKREHETTAHFDGKFDKDVLASFVSTHKLPLVIVFSRENSSLIFDNPIKKQLLLFAGGEDFNKIYPVYQTAAKALQGKLLFVHVDTVGEDAQPILEYFGVTAEQPKVVGFSSQDQGRKYLLEKDITAESLKTFGEDFLEDKLEPFYKSAPVPETNDEDVKIVVGKNFDDIVLDESKDVLLEIYAPWCGHCQALEPIYNKLANRLREVKSLVIAKMDGTANEHPRAKSDGFPTILFFPAGNKSFDPLTVDTERTIKAFYQYLKKNAAIPFTLPKAPTSEAEPDITTTTSSSDDLKDEL